MEKRMFEELKKAYRPEFINRIDEKVVFHSLSSDHMQEVVKIMVKPLVASLAEKGIDLKLQASALKLLANQGYDPEMGARPLRRTLQTEVEDKLAELLLKGELVAGKTLKIGVKAGQLKFDIAFFNSSKIRFSIFSWSKRMSLAPKPTVLSSRRAVAPRFDVMMIMVFEKSTLRPLLNYFQTLKEIPCFIFS